MGPRNFCGSKGSLIGLSTVSSSTNFVDQREPKHSFHHIRTRGKILEFYPRRNIFIYFCSHPLMPPPSIQVTLIKHQLPGWVPESWWEILKMQPLSFSLSPNVLFVGKIAIKQVTKSRMWSRVPGFTKKIRYGCLWRFLVSLQTTVWSRGHPLNVGFCSNHVVWRVGKERGERDSSRRPKTQSPYLIKLQKAPPKSADRYQVISPCEERELPGFMPYFWISSVTSPGRSLR